MSGSAFSVLATVLVALLALVVVSAPAFIVLPIALLIIGVIFGVPLLKGVREGSVAASEPHGVPSTREASFDPQIKP